MFVTRTETNKEAVDSFFDDDEDGDWGFGFDEKPESGVERKGSRNGRTVVCSSESKSCVQSFKFAA